MSPSLSADVSMTDVDNGLVLLDERNGTYFQMNSTGALVLRALVRGADEPEIVALLRETYGVEADRASADVKALLDKLGSAGLITSGAVK